MSEKIIELPNGLRIAYKYAPHTRSVHCGYIIDVGGRDDFEDAAGMSHFIEHLVFKGTTRRKTFHILNYIESVGGDVNAYTTKEKTCVYASLSSEHVERAIDVLTDIVFFSIFPEKEIVKEKQVILEEIDMYRDAPDEAIFEDFDALVFPNHSLGIPILGTKESLPLIDREKIAAFRNTFYTKERIVFSIAGNITEKELMKWANKYMKDLPLLSGNPPRIKPLEWTAKNETVEISTHQAHEVIGGRAIDMRHEDYAAFSMLVNWLGGSAMNSRLNLNIREKYGWAYNISAFYAPFLDTGLWGIYYACDVSNLKKIRNKVIKELSESSKKVMGSLQFSHIQKQLIGQLVLGNENLVNQMLGMGKELLDFGKLIAFEDYIKRIEKVNPIYFQGVAERHFTEKNTGIITYLPKEEA